LHSLYAEIYFHNNRNFQQAVLPKGYGFKMSIYIPMNYLALKEYQTIVVYMSVGIKKR